MGGDGSLNVGESGGNGWIWGIFRSRGNRISCCTGCGLCEKRGARDGSQVYGPCSRMAGSPLTDVSKASASITCLSVSLTDFALSVVCQGDEWRDPGGSGDAWGVASWPCGSHRRVEDLQFHYRKPSFLENTSN